MESVSNWTECSESGCSQVTREVKCANHTKNHTKNHTNNNNNNHTNRKQKKKNHTNELVQLSWTQAMPCPQCDQVFLSPRALKDHLHLLHWGQLVHQCDHCGETFYHREQLKTHKNSSHSSIVEEAIEIPMESKSFEKVKTGEEEEEKDSKTSSSNNSAIYELLSEIDKADLANFTRAYIGSVRKHLDFKHQECFTDCLHCFSEDPLSVLFARKTSNVKPFDGQEDTFDQLWRRNVLRKGNEEKLINNFNSTDLKLKAGDAEKREAEKEYSEKEEECMDLGESDAEDEDLEDYEETDDEMEETNTTLVKDVVSKTICEKKSIIGREMKELTEEPCKKTPLDNMNIGYNAPLRRRIYGLL